MIIKGIKEKQIIKKSRTPMAEHFILWGMKILEFHRAKKEGKLDSPRAVMSG